MLGGFVNHVLREGAIALALLVPFITGVLFGDVMRGSEKGNVFVLRLAVERKMDASRKKWYTRFGKGQSCAMGH